MRPQSLLSDLAAARVGNIGSLGGDLVSVPPVTTSIGGSSLTCIAGASQVYVVAAGGGIGATNLTFLLRNISLSTLSGSTLALNFVIVIPAEEKTLSLGTSMAGMARYRLARGSAGGIHSHVPPTNQDWWKCWQAPWCSLWPPFQLGTCHHDHQSVGSPSGQSHHPAGTASGWTVLMKCLHLFQVQFLFSWVEQEHLCQPEQQVHWLPPPACQQAANANSCSVGPEQHRGVGCHILQEFLQYPPWISCGGPLRLPPLHLIQWLMRPHLQPGPQEMG